MKCIYFGLHYLVLQYHNVYLQFSPADSFLFICGYSKVAFSLHECPVLLLMETFGRLHMTMARKIGHAESFHNHHL